MKTHCDRCGVDCRPYPDRYPAFIPVGDLVELTPFYTTIFTKHLCSKCGDEANSFINYYGRKRESDIANLRQYLKSGSVSSITVDRIYSQLMNGGYYVS